MRAKLIALLIFSVLASRLSAQTKLISHKSHSGSKKHFKIALAHKLFNLPASNFGAGPQPMIKTAQLDSVIFMNNSEVIMVTSNYCDWGGWAQSSVWKAGKDTLYNHPLFSRKHSLDSIKNILKRNYNFQNPIDSVKFIGFDNEKAGTASATPETHFEVSIPSSPQWVGDRTVKKAKKIIVKHQTIEFEVWDHHEIDGDTISLIFNGQCILEKHFITKEKKRVKVDLIPNADNYLILYAHNLGKIPPNTVSLIIHDGTEKRDVILRSDLKSCEALNITYTPPSKTKKNSIPFTGIEDNDRTSPFDHMLIWVFGVICVFSLALGMIYRNASSQRSI